VVRPRATTLRQLALGLAMTDEETRSLLLLGRTGHGAAEPRLATSGA